MIPQGIPAKSCSAFWQARALAEGVVEDFPVRASRNVWKATSSAAELETPPPTGTEETMAALKPV